MYNLTLLLCVVVGIDCAMFLGKAVFPPKNAD